MSIGFLLPTPRLDFKTCNCYELETFIRRILVKDDGRWRHLFSKVACIHFIYQEAMSDKTRKIEKYLLSINFICKRSQPDTIKH